MDALQPFLSRLVALQSCRLPESTISCPFSSTSPGSGVLILYSLHQDPATTHYLHLLRPSRPLTQRPSDRRNPETRHPSPVTRQREARPPLPPSSLCGAQSSPVPTPDSQAVCALCCCCNTNQLRLSWLGASQILPLPQSSCHERRPHRRAFDSSNLNRLPAAHGTPRRLRECLATSVRLVTDSTHRRCPGEGPAKMRLPYLAAALVFDLLLLAPTVVAADCQASGALWLQPSTQWYDDRLHHPHDPRAHTHMSFRLGIDGKWSFFAVQVGSSAPQTVYLSPATALSELWVVQPSGCSPCELPCRPYCDLSCVDTESSTSLLPGTW